MGDEEHFSQCLSAWQYNRYIAQARGRAEKDVAHGRVDPGNLPALAMARARKAAKRRHPARFSEEVQLMLAYHEEYIRAVRHQMASSE